MPARCFDNNVDVDGISSAKKFRQAGGGTSQGTKGTINNVRSVFEHMGCFKRLRPKTIFIVKCKDIHGIWLEQ